MYTYCVAFIVNGKQLNAWFDSPVEYSEEPTTKHQIREFARQAVHVYLREARNVPSTGNAESLALYPEILPSKGVIQPIDAFEMND